MHSGRALPSAASPRVEVPDPALVVLVGASGSGKSTWAAEHFAAAEVVSSDALRAVVGSGPGDLDASVEAFALLDQIVAGRLKRRLTTVIDTLGLDAARRTGYLAAARAVGLPAVAVLVRAAEDVCRARNAARDRPVPAPVLRGQLRTAADVAGRLATEGFDGVLAVDTDITAGPSGSTPPQAPARPALPAATSDQGRDRRDDRPEVILQLSRFPWGDDPLRWLTAVARRASEVGFAGIALMDHLIQIPQVGRAWEPIPEPWVTLGALAGLGLPLKLGTLVTPVTFRPSGITAKAAATLDVLTGGRAFVGLGAGWWEREHRAYGLPFPPAAERLDQLETGIETLRALWSTGTKPFAGDRVTLPETTCYPRPVGRIPIIVGGSGEQRTLRIVARYADGCNLPSDLPTLDHKLAVLRRHCAEVGRDPAEVSITVLDLPIVGTDRADVARLVEKLRGRTAAAVFAARHHAGVAGAHQERYRLLAERGVSTAFVAVADLTGPDDLDRWAPLLSR